MKTEVHIKLIKQLRKGSKDAFTKLYMIYSDQIYAFSLKLTKSPTESEDILQEVFARIWVNREKISTDLSFKSYLFKISYNIIIDHFRKQICYMDFEKFINSEYYQSASVDELEQKINFDDYSRLIDQSLARLSSRQQEIFHLSRIEKMTAKKIGEKLGLAEKTVNNQLSYILATLKADILISTIIVSYVIQHIFLSG